MRQVSPESIAIFDFILELHASCTGDWESLTDSEISAADVRQLLTYAATFLSNVGNYYVSVARFQIPIVISLILEGVGGSEVHSGSKTRYLSENFRQIPKALGFVS